MRTDSSGTVSLRPGLLRCMLGLAVLSLGLAACSPMGNGMHGRRGGSFDSNGERIYQTGASSSGRIIAYSGGPGGPMMGGTLACADCHGDAGTGGRVTIMMRTFTAPDITWPELTGKHGDEHGGEQEHAPYTPESVRRAITEGVDPSGEPLDELMPRWQMADQDLADLVAYLQSLGDGTAPSEEVP